MLQISKLANQEQSNSLWELYHNMHYMNKGIDAATEWNFLLVALLSRGNKVRVKETNTLERINYTSVVNMNYPVVTQIKRKLGYRFMPAEAYWILSGRQDVEFMKRFSKKIDSFSDNGLTFDGAYGPKVVSQLRYIVDTLFQDPTSRQAVLTIWRENPRKSKDIPCTISMQFIIREDTLECITNMRSSDAWLGWPYDVFNFSMIATAVRTMLLEQYNVSYKIGRLYLNAGSQHLYEHNIPDAHEIALDLLNHANLKHTDLNHVNNVAVPEVPFSSYNQMLTHLKALAELDTVNIDNRLPFTCLATW